MLKDKHLKTEHCFQRPALPQARPDRSTLAQGTVITFSTIKAAHSAPFS